ncbi:hypothetical protein [Acinetobacter thermotolerans]|uniref:hypothetical protein n=1 Tax=Acinetobacter thermotolerans TaxID=3151487 RepID=UPI00325B2A3E
MHNQISTQVNTPEQPVLKFGEPEARMLIKEMIDLYGKKFFDQWAGNTKGQVIAKFVQKLSMLTHEQFYRGLKRLDRAGWPPTIPEFKDWCLGGSRYQTADEAWLQALSFEKENRSAPINRIAKAAYDSVVGPYGTLNGTDTHYKVFCSVYKRLVTEADERNEPDEVLETVKQIGSNPENFHQPVPNEVAQKALENLKKQLNVKNRSVPKPQRLPPKATIPPDPWPDPFDDPAAYLEQCRSDGVEVPKVIREQLREMQSK